MRRTTLALLATGLLVAAVWPSRGSGRQRVEPPSAPATVIEGTVTNHMGRPIASVLVQVRTDDRFVGEVRTNEHGEYRVSGHAGGRPVSCIRYSHSEYHDGVVELLSGRQGQSIHKVLFSVDETLSHGDAKRQLLAYQSLFQAMHDVADPNAKPADAKKLAEKIAKLKVKGKEEPAIAGLRRETKDLFERVSDPGETDNNTATGDGQAPR